MSQGRDQESRAKLGKPPRDLTTLVSTISWLPWFLALLSGLMVGGSFPPWEHRWLTWMPWLALAPLCCALWLLPRPDSSRAWARHCFLLGWLGGTVSFLISLQWITTVTAPGWVALSLIVGLYHGVWALFAGLVLRPFGETENPASAWLGSLRNFIVALLAAAAWVAVEWLRGTLFSGFGWNSLGVALRHSIPLIQIAGITGTAGLTFLCVLIAATAVITVERLRREIRLRRTRPHFDFMLAVLLVVLCFGYGVRKITAPPLETTPLRVAALQGNVPVYDYWDPKCETRIMEGYLRQTRTALTQDPDLVIWPEAATPRPLLLDEIIFNHVKQVASGTRADFLIGSVHYEQEPRGDYNSAILLTKHAGAAQIYNKVHLVPFGEFVPFRKGFPLVSWIVGNRVPYDFDPGKGPALLELSQHAPNTAPAKLGPLLCFEDTLGDLTRQFAALGAQLLVTLTNDGWFEHSIATRQHLANAQLRTVETGLPLLRVADTGITCYVDRFGRVRDILRAPNGNTFIEGILQVTVPVPVHPVPTFYTRHGDLFAHTCLALTVAAAALAALISRRNSRKGTMKG
jgi:apolipoprotein N-acyltransferase